MKQFIKDTLRSIIKTLTSSFSSTKVGRLVNEVIIDDVMSRVHEVEYQGQRLKFTVPNAFNQFRVDTLSTKEPETLEWPGSLAGSLHIVGCRGEHGFVFDLCSKKEKFPGDCF